MEDDLSDVVTPDLANLIPDIPIPDWLPTIGLDLSPAADLITRGGPVVAILVMMSIIAVTVILFKGGQFLVRGVGKSGRTEQALATWFSGRHSEATGALTRSSNPAAVVLRHAMSAVENGVDEPRIREDAEHVALTELANTKAYLRILESISQIAPLLGLFGTVIGMMSAFQALQTSGADADPAVLAGGIWVALITTAVGLAVAIPTSFSLYWFEGRIERETNLIEASLTSLFTGRLRVPTVAPSNRETFDNVTRFTPDAAE